MRIVLAVILSIVLGWWASIPVAHAGGLGSDVSDFFNDINFTNYTAPGVYQGQTAGYYTGGSIYSRTPVRDYRILSVQTPRFRAGCGGIDLFSGGFSIINADQFVDMLRNIGADAKSLAFMLAMSVVSPQISNAMSKVQDWAQRANQGQINSCETAGWALGGALETFGARTQSCIVQAVSEKGEDWATADKHCRVDPHYADGSGAAPPPSFTHGNVAWQAMMKIDFFKNDLQLAKTVMNLTGTVIVHDDGTANSDANLEYIPSQLTQTADPHSNNLVGIILEGGEATIQGCSDESTRPDGCMTITPSETVRVADTDGLINKVHDLLQNLVDDIREDTPVNDGSEEMALMRATSLPIYKYLTVSASYMGSSTESDITGYSQLIAKDLLYSYLVDLLKKVDEGAMSIHDSQSIVQDFRERVRDARAAVSTSRIQLSADFDAELQLTTKTRLIEKALIGTISPRIMQSASFQADR